MAENPSNTNPATNPETPAKPVETAPKKRGKTGRIILAVVMLAIIGVVCFICYTDQGIMLLARTMETAKSWFPGGSPEKEKVAAQTIEDLGLMVVREAQNAGMTASNKEGDENGDKVATARNGESQNRDLQVTSIARKEKHVDKKVFAVLPDLYRIGTVNMTETDIADEDLKSVSKLRHLTSLLLGGTAISDEGIAYLRNMGELESLHLQNTRITDAGMAHLAAIPNLTILDISGDNITDAGMKELARCQKLNWLLMRNTPITDAGLQALEKLPRLGRLTIFNTKTTPAGIAKLVKALAANDVKLSVDSGTLPKDEGPAKGAITAPPANGPESADRKMENPTPDDRKPADLEPEVKNDQKPEVQKPADDEPGAQKSDESKPADNG